mgnify:CR=1 FL=1
MILHVYTDGGARGNPGPAAIGVVVKEYQEETSAEILRNKFGKKIGIATNNVAEYRAVLEALGFMIGLQNQGRKIEKINVYLDSQLVASQLGGIFKIKDPTLKKLFLMIKEQEKKLGVAIFYFHIPRAQNVLADREVNLSLDQI